MKTKKVLETIDVMTESVVKELNDMSEKIDNKANHSYVQTIAKHLMNLESRVEELEKEKCSCKPKIADPDVKEVCYPRTDNSFDALRKAVYIASTNSLIDFCKSKIGIPGRETVQFNGEPLEVTEMQKEVLRTLFVDKTGCQIDYFLKAKNLLIEYAEKTMIKKGMEYTPVGDRFANFRPILGEKKTAIEKLIGYNAKHVQYCFMQSENPSYPSDTYKRENTAIGYIFGFGKDRKEKIPLAEFHLRLSKYNKTDMAKLTGGYNVVTLLENCIKLGQLQIVDNYYVLENKEYYKQCYINELLEHWGDVFNYNVLGLAMQNTDKEPYYIVPYADREAQEKEIKNIVDKAKNIDNISYTYLSSDDRFNHLLSSITFTNLFNVIYLFGLQLSSLEN